MSVVFLIFAGLVIYWTVMDHRAAHGAAPTVVRATVPIPATSRLTTTREPAASTGPATAGTFWTDYLTDHDREALMSTATLRTYRTGEIVFHEGDDANTFCLLLSGRVGLLTNVGHGRHLLAGTLGPGRLFAWSGMVGDHHYTATIHTVLDCEVAFFPAEEVRRLCDADPVLGYHLMNEIAADIAERVHERDERFGSLVAG